MRDYPILCPGETVPGYVIANELDRPGKTRGVRTVIPVKGRA